MEDGKLQILSSEVILLVSYFITSIILNVFTKSSLCRSLMLFIYTICSEHFSVDVFEKLGFLHNEVMYEEFIGLHVSKLVNCIFFLFFVCLRFVDNL